MAFVLDKAKASKQRGLRQQSIDEEHQKKQMNCNIDRGLGPRRGLGKGSKHHHDPRVYSQHVASNKARAVNSVFSFRSKASLISICDHLTQSKPWAPKPYHPECCGKMLRGEGFKSPFQNLPVVAISPWYHFDSFCITIPGIHH